MLTVSTPLIHRQAMNTNNIDNRSITVENPIRSKIGTEHYNQKNEKKKPKKITWTKSGVQFLCIARGAMVKGNHRRDRTWYISNEQQNSDY